MSDVAFWRRLDTAGHDAAQLRPGNGGWTLRGTAVFRHEQGPACINYCVRLDASWRTLRGAVSGFVAARTVSHVITRESDRWFLDGRVATGVEGLMDLDYGFTPAANLQQLRRVGIEPGQSVELPVAWFDHDLGQLQKLPQRYERRSETTFWYTAPTVPYEGLLELSPSGFVRKYPLLWEMEP